MGRLELSIGIGHYDHVMDLTSGAVDCKGLELRHLSLPAEEIFHRFIKYREWDISEISMAKYCALVSQDDTSLIGLPVFPSRMFRHSSMYVRADSGITDPTHLAGKRVGVPEWAQTAAVYTRGMLVHDYGVALSDVEWYQAGVNQPGRAEKVHLHLPPNVNCHRVPDRSLSEMLLARDLDAVFSAHPPQCFEENPDRVVRLFADAPAVEREYWARTGVFPIMHAVVVKREVVEANPWLPTTLLSGFEEAKNRSLQRLVDMSVSRFPVPSLQAYTEAAAPGYGGRDAWPYGIEPNRTTLETFLQYALEQGVLVRPVKAEELFWPPLNDTYRV